MTHRLNIVKRITMCMLLLTVLTGCMNAARNPQETGGTTGTSAAATSQTTTAAKTQEEQLTDELEKEAAVKLGKIYIQDGTVVCTMVIKEDANTEDAKKLAQRYADKLKGMYKDKPVSVQAVQKNKNIANIDV